MFTREDLRAEGVIVEALADCVYRLELLNGHSCVARLAKELQKNLISFLPGDKVLIVFQPYDMSRGRILSRFPPTL